ncbi:MAG: very short patch repair endonuclease [Chloroflexota bacterium]
MHRAGYRYRLHSRDLPGKPDLVFPRLRLATFVHGCFWHGHVCKEAKPPKSNLQYWSPKIAGNMRRDRRSANRLRRSGWHVATIRECELERGTVRLLRRLEHLTETNASD